MQAITAGQYYLVYNSLSFTIATFATATLFFWFGRSQCSANYRTAVTITGLVTFIALYHYWRRNHVTLHQARRCRSIDDCAGLSW